METICTPIPHPMCWCDNSKTLREPFHLLGKSGREAADVVSELALVAEELDVGAVDLDAAGSLLVEVLLTSERSEAPVLGDNDLLSARELVLGSAEGLEGNGAGL